MIEYDYETNSIGSNRSEISTNNFKLLQNCVCRNDQEDYTRQPSIIEFAIRGLSNLIYFICWIISLWFVIASLTFDIIRYIYRAPKFIRTVAAILSVLLIMTTSIHLIILTRPRSTSSSIDKSATETKVLKAKEITVLNKYAEYEKLPAKKQAEILKTLSPEEAKLFILLDSLPPDSKSLVKELDKKGVTSTEKITKFLSPSTSKEKNEILGKMSKTERDKFKELETQIAKNRPPHLKIKVLDKRKPYSSHMGNPNETIPISKKITLIVKEDDCGLIYEENKLIEIRKNKIGKLPSLELSLDKILIEDY